MRAFLLGTAAVLALGQSVLAAPAAAPMSPADIQSTFFTGTPFTASASANLKYKMVFAADGKMTREPIGTGGSKAEGTWKLSKEGFCSTWKGSKASCFRVLPAGDNKWSIVKGTSKVATWSK